MKRRSLSGPRTGATESDRHTRAALTTELEADLADN
jgi:hypothetical protein